ncbi:MAG: FtsX-like permease family protein [Reyranellaceae bacterium]
MTRLPLALRLARREMRSGLSGFRLFIACLALGVAAIAGILSFSRAVEEGLRADAREILGGDVAVSLLYREATPEQVEFLRGRGTLTAWIDSRAMARPERADGRATLVQLKAVDPAYPLYGTVELKSGAPLADALARRDGTWGAVVEEAALRRMNLTLGDRVRVGDAVVQIRDVIAREPDRGLNAFASLGPRLMIPFAAVTESGLVQPGSLLNWEYRLRLPPGSPDTATLAALKARFPDAGWRLRGLAEAGGGIRVWLDRLTQFIGLIGLASLLVGGVGVGNAIGSFLAGRLRTIAIMKCVGAPERLVFATYFLQLAALALLGVAIGLAVGGTLPFLAQSLIAEVLPVRARVALYAEPLAVAAVFGLLVSLLFALLPLLRARRVSAATLMRGAVVPTGRRRLAWRDGLLVGAVAAALAAFTIFTADSRSIAAWFVLGAVAAFLAFPLLARLLMALAARSGKPRLAGLRLALANLHRPGAPTPIVMLSLGLGLTVLVATALIEGNLREQLTRRIPSDAPAFFFVDIQSSQMAEFEQAIAAIPGAGAVDKVPSLRGRIVKIGGKPIGEVAVPSEARWAVEGDRGITYAATPPPGSHLVAGEWWPADYRGPTLISFDEALARAFGLGLGDTITVNVLGRDIEARIASLRRIEWTTLAINFVFVYSPGLLDKAPHTFLATVKATPQAEDRIFDMVTTRFPNVTVVRIRDAIATAAEVLANIGLASRVIGFLSILAGVLVLAGAMLATQRRRIHEAVVMKVLGATRARIAGIFAWEFAALGLATALAALGIGTLGAWLVISRLMGLDWTFLPGVAIAVAGGATLLTLAFGLAGTIAALRQRPLALLRND